MTTERGWRHDLGVGAVELLPIFAFDEEDGPPGLGNYWGIACRRVYPVS